MRAFLKSTYHSTVNEMQNQMQYASIRVLGTSGISICDAQSTCAKAARDIVSLLNRKQNNTYQDMRIQEEIMALLDHEKLLTHFQCHALALLTLQEAIRLLIISDADSSQLLFLQSTQVQLRQNYSDKPLIPMHYYDEVEQAAMLPPLELLVPKHVGHGMKYLAALKKYAPPPQQQRSLSSSSSSLSRSSSSRRFPAA